VLPDVAGYAAAAVRGDPFPDLRDITGAPGWLTGPVMAMLADDPASRPAADECVQLLSSAQFPPPVAGQPVRSRHLPGLLGSGPFALGLPGSDPVEPGPATGATSAGPVAALVTRPEAPRTAAPRPRRAGRGALAVAGLLVLLLAGSVTAWRLSDASSSRGLAASGAATTTAAAGATPVAAAGSASRRSSAAATRPSTAAVAPATSPSVTWASSRPASPTASTAAPQSASPTASPSASPSVSAPASSAPPLVPVPDVVGMTFTRARLLLVSDGFTVVGKHKRLGQVVTRTKPAAGEAPAGSLIIVVYGTGAPLLPSTARTVLARSRGQRGAPGRVRSPALSSPF
jgi:hypothetical protein